MRALFTLLTAIVIAAAPAAAVRGATLGDARIGFTAERVLVLDGKSYTGRMWNMPGMQRHEQVVNGFTPVFILHADRAVGDLVVPQLHTVVEFDFPQALAALSRPDLLHQPIGSETINGIATTKYAVDDETPQGRVTGTLWLSRDGIPMKADGKLTEKNGKVSTARWELRHVTIGNQPAHLFELPKGFSTLPVAAVAPLLGMRLKGPKH